LHPKTENTALHIASYMGHNKIVKLLLEYGASRCSIKNKDDLTPFEVARTQETKTIFEHIVAYTAPSTRFFKILNEHLARYIIDNFDDFDPKKYNHGLVNFGGKIMNLTFLSTSKRLEMAEIFSGKGELLKSLKHSNNTCIQQQPTLIRYTIKNHHTALDIENISKIPDEKEVLIPPFALFKVIYVERNNASCYNEIHLEECDESICKTLRTHLYGLFSRKTFDYIFNELDKNTSDRRWNAFLIVNEKMKWKPINKEDVATFFAHVHRQKTGLKFLALKCDETRTCNYTQKHPWCNDYVQPMVGRQYYGRGWIQLWSHCNYYNASQALSIDLLSNPDLVSQNEVIASQVAMWYWKAYGMREYAAKGQFNETTKLLTPNECPKVNRIDQYTRVQTYLRVRQCYGLQTSIGDSLYC
ncbi:unnamed protein product, partial [Didymodactylos carnosus]